MVKEIVDNTKKVDLFLYDDFRHAPDEVQEKCHILYNNGASLKDALSFCRKEVLRLSADRLKKEANLSKRFKERTFETFKPYTDILKTAFNKAKKYAELLNDCLQDGTNIIFEGHGCVGTGKTHLAYAIANYALDNGVPTRIINTTQLVTALSYKTVDENFKKSLYSVPLLVIDDLGKECGYDWLLFEIYGILNARYESCKPTVITTEDTIADLSKYYQVSTASGIKNRGKSIFSRICENVVFVSVTGDDYRLKRG